MPSQSQSLLFGIDESGAKYIFQSTALKYVHLLYPDSPLPLILIKVTSLADKTDLLALCLSGTYCRKTSTRSPSCQTPRQPTINDFCAPPVDKPKLQFGVCDKPERSLATVDQVSGPTWSSSGPI